jgi:hypothetical protein
MADAALDGYRFKPEWAILVQSLVGAPLVKIGLVLRQHSPQMPLVQDDQLIQAFFPNRSYPTLGDSIRIGLWGSKNRSECNSTVKQPVDSHDVSP